MTPTSDGADATKSATVRFEKETAAKTALLLDKTQLGPAQVHVTAAASLDELSSGGNQTSSSNNNASSSDDVEQEDKPRSRILAEYLAHGYVVSEKAIERALALDQQHGLSSRFTTALKSFDEKFHASERAQAVDARLGVTGRAVGAWRGFGSYFDKALDTPTGRRLRAFYEAGNKQVVDVHNEARHLANLKSGKDGAQPSSSATETGAGDGKSSDKATLQHIEGTDKTRCACKADLGKCPCEPGKCACDNCGKNTDVKSTAV